MARSSLFSTPAPERETKQQSRGEDVKYDARRPGCRATLVFPVHKRPLAGKVTLQIPLPHDVLGMGVPQASVHLSHTEMEALVAQRHVQQQQGGHSHSQQLQKRRREERKELTTSCSERFTPAVKPPEAVPRRGMDGKPQGPAENQSKPAPKGTTTMLVAAHTSSVSYNAASHSKAELRDPTSVSKPGTKASPCPGPHPHNQDKLVFFFVYHFLLGGGGAFLPRCPTLKAPQALPILQNLLQALGCAPRAREHKALGALQRLR